MKEVKVRSATSDLYEDYLKGECLIIAEKDNCSRMWFVVQVGGYGWAMRDSSGLDAVTGWHSTRKALMECAAKFGYRFFLVDSSIFS